jgi:mannose-6-phosphate isomerase-like protein (cupin superfamily)
MAKSGDVLEHPGTGERIVWRQVAHDTNGELLVGDMFASPGGHPALPHVHPHQEERFEVLRGRIRMQVDGVETVLGPGERATVPAGTAHTWSNIGHDVAQIRVELQPALRSEMFFETLFGLAKDGRTNSKGLPSVLSMAVIMHEYADEIRLARPAPGVQRAIVRPLAWLGRRFGHRGWYPAYTSHPLQKRLTQWSENGDAL